MGEIAILARSSFADNLQKARKLRGLTQSELSVKAGIHVGAIGHFESGGREPSCSNIRKLAVALMVSSDYLLGIAAVIVPSSNIDPISRAAGTLHRADDLELVIDFIALLQRRAAQSRFEERSDTDPSP